MTDIVTDEVLDKLDLVCTRFNKLLDEGATPNPVAQAFALAIFLELVPALTDEIRMHRADD